MDLSLTEEEAAVRELFGEFFAAECPPSTVRESAPLGFDPKLWERLGETGLPGLAVTGARGGSGASLRELVLVAEEAGRVLAPVPAVEHAVATRVLERAGAPDAILAPAASGAAVATIDLRPEDPAADTLELVPWAAVAHLVVALHGEDLVLVRGEPPGASVENLAGVAIADRALGAPEVLASGEEALAAHRRSLDEWRLLSGAFLVGVAAASLDLAVDYVRERHQFGVPVGSFQSVQHGLAELAGSVDGARLLVGKGAWANELGAGDAEELAVMALLFASKVAREASARALHYHGGYGFMEEYDVQLYYRHAQALPMLLDSAGEERRRLGDLLYGPRREGRDRTQRDEGS